MLRHQLYIPKPGELNDPKEARPKIAPASVGKFIKTLLRLRPAMSPGEEQYHRRVLEYNLPRLGGADLVIQSFEDGLLKQFENQRIYSVSKRPNNLHLWKKYAAGHRGYCLEFRTDGVFKGHIKEVRYRDYYEADITGPSQLVSAFFYYKTTEWRREEELRIIGRRSADSGTITFDPSMLTRIILGKKMPAEQKEIVRHWAQKRLPTLKVEFASDMILE
jgi:hypothetical protein